MKKNVILLPTLLTALLFAALLAEMLVQVWVPAAVLPPLNIPLMVTFCVVALLLEYLFIGRTARNYIVVFVFGAMCFGVLPLLAGMACVHTFWKLGVIGAVCLTVVTFLFTSATQRIAGGKKTVAAVLMLSIGICLVSQCFAGIFI